VRPVPRPDEVVGPGPAAPAESDDLEFDFAQAEDEQSSVATVPRQGERKLFDFGADEPWEPPANGPTAALPPWMLPRPADPAQAEPVVAEPVVVERVQAEPVVAEPVPAEPPTVEAGPEPVGSESFVPAQAMGPRRRRRPEPVDVPPLVVPMLLVGSAVETSVVEPVPALPACPAPAVLDRIVDACVPAPVPAALPVVAPAIVTPTPRSTIAPIPLATPPKAPPKTSFEPFSPLKAAAQRSAQRSAQTSAVTPPTAPAREPVREPVRAGVGAPRPAPVAPARPVVAAGAVGTQEPPGRRLPPDPAVRRLGRTARRFAPAVVVGMLGALGLSALLDGGSEATAAPDAAAVQARDWVLANLDQSMTVLAPKATARDLTTHGHAPDRVVAYGDAPSDSTDPACCSFLVVTGTSAPKAAAALPASVRKAYDRSRPTAAFDVGGRHAEVRQILDLAPGDVAASVASDRRILAAAGRELAGSAKLKLSDHARSALVNGNVDPRVAVAVVSVTGAHTLTVSDFPAGPGEADTGAWRRAVVITKIDGRSVVPGSSTVKDVQALLAGQKAPYRPAATTVTRHGDVGTLTITFRAPSPLGLVASAH
jgi:hypothetical protein